MTYKSTAPNVTHEIFVSTPFLKYINTSNTLDPQLDPDRFQNEADPV